MQVSDAHIIIRRPFLMSSVVARGFMRSGQGNPDEARAARYILKDYVNAKLLYCHPPPGISEDRFNEETRQIALTRALGKKRAPTTRVVKGADTFVPQNGLPSGSSMPSGVGIGSSAKSQSLDQDFFASNASSLRPRVQGSARHGQEVSRMQVYPHQNAVADDGSVLTGRKARIAGVLANAGGEVALNGKKHHKKPKRVKQRSGRGYD